VYLGIPWTLSGFLLQQNGIHQGHIEQRPLRIRGG
jgi:hypothetical protein